MAFHGKLGKDKLCLRGEMGQTPDQKNHLIGCKISSFRVWYVPKGARTN